MHWCLGIVQQVVAYIGGYGRGTEWSNYAEDVVSKKVC